ncbi:MAG: DUF6261 family protein [Prevotellaceae bacterium]|jgi:hypothetical protein|nr:DUF6261 family protein [Prevotellaceae bacterium]
MKKFIRFTLRQLKRGAYFNFITQFYALCMGNKLIAQKAAAVLALLAAAIAQVDLALAIQRKSGYTEEITALNAQRHAFLVALKAAVKGFLGIASTQDDAKALLQLFKDYGIKRSMQIDQATGLFTNLLADLQGKFASAIKAMNLQTFVTNMKETNTKLQKAVEDRLDEANSNGTARLMEARKEADNLYHQVIEFIESLVRVEGEEKYTEFIDRANTLIKHYKQEVLGQKVTEKIPGSNNPGDDEEEPPQG